MNEPLDRTLNRWIDGELNAAEAVALEQRLLADPDARRALYDLSITDHLLSGGMEPAAFHCPKIRTLADSPAEARVRRRLWHLSLAAAAVLMLALITVFSLHRGSAGLTAFQPTIAGSADSRITVAQRQDPASGWAPGEVLRIERGSACLQLAPDVTAHIDGPAAIELLDHHGNIRLFEGNAGFDIGPTGRGFEVVVPGGIIRDLGTRFALHVHSDGNTDIQVEIGEIEVATPILDEAIVMRAGDAMKLDVEGQPAALSHDHGRYPRPDGSPVVLFDDRFLAPDGTLLADHQPSAGIGWDIREEASPTVIANERLDTSFGARELIARFNPPPPRSVRDVYVLTIDLLQPAHIHDKVKRQDGYESITLLDEDDHPVVSLRAAATHGHRWWLHDESADVPTPHTNVGALWPHTLTLCYDHNGRVTLHDGASAQAPIIAELRLDRAPPLSGVLFLNRTGGDLAIERISASLLQQADAAP
jgi:hypothetical protein